MRHSSLAWLPALRDAQGQPSPFLEADIRDGVRAVGVAEFDGLNCRICRPVGLSAAEVSLVIAYVVDRLGLQYDMKNVVDLARYLLPTPPVPVRWRRRMLALGSGDPTRAICSTLIAQAFQAVQLPDPAGDRDPALARPALPRLRRRDPARAPPQPVRAARLRCLALLRDRQTERWHAASTTACCPGANGSAGQRRRPPDRPRAEIGIHRIRAQWSADRVTLGLVAARGRAAFRPCHRGLAPALRDARLPADAPSRCVP